MAAAALRPGGAQRIRHDVVAEDGNRALAAVHQRGDNADQGGFAGAVRSEQREEVTLGDVEADPLQGDKTTLVGFFQITDRQCGRHAQTILIRNNTNRITRAIGRRNPAQSRDSA